VGIRQDVIKKLFDLDNVYTSKGTNNEVGTGLGLKLCKEFVIKYNGEINVSSEVDKGRTFTIILPVSI
jgi:signal transduction histidine kinase